MAHDLFINLYVLLSMSTKLSGQTNGGHIASNDDEVILQWEEGKRH